MAWLIIIYTVLRLIFTSASNPPNLVLSSPPHHVLGCLLLSFHLFLRVGEFDNAPLLGSAMLAAVGAGAFNDINDDGKDTRASSSTSTSSVVTGTDTRTRASSKSIKSSGKESQEQGTMSDHVDSLVLLRRLQRAAKAMVRERLRVEPDAGRKARYDRVLLCHCVLSIRGLCHYDCSCL